MRRNLTFGRTHQGELAVLQRGRRQNVAHQGFAEHDAARADHRNLGHGFSLCRIGLDLCFASGIAFACVRLHSASGSQTYRNPRALVRRFH
jgi:hypothetical protein